MANGEHIEVAKAFITIVPSLEGSQKSIAESMGAVAEPAAKDAGEKSGKTLGENLAKGLKTTTAVIAGAMAAATGAAIATGKALVQAANETAAYGDEVDKTSQKMGLSAESYQEWDYVMKIAGTEMSSMTTGLKTLTNQIDDAKNGSEDAQNRFAALGITMEDLATMSREDIFAATIAGFQGMADSTDRAALANDLFGKSGQNLAPLFNMTSEETQGLIDKANEYGMVMSDEAVKASADYKDSLTTLSSTMKGLKNQMMSQLLPSFTKVTSGLSAIFAGDKSGIGLIQEGIQSTIDNISKMAPDLMRLAEVIISSLLKGFAPMLPQAVSSIFSFINEALVTITGLIPQLTPVIVLGIQGILQALFSSLPVMIDGLTTLLVDLVTWLSQGNNVTMFVSGVIELVSKLASSLSTVLPVLLPAIVTIISELALALTDPKNLNMLLNATFDIVEAIFQALVNSISKIVELVIRLNENILKSTFTFLGTLLSRLGQWFGQAILNVANFAKSIFDRVKDLPNKFLNLGKDIIQGLINGVKKLASSAVDTVKNIGTNLVNGVKSVLKIGSPSKVFAQIGAWTAEGFAIGYEDTMDDVATDMQNSMNDLTGNMSATVTAYGPQNSASIGGGTVYNGGNISINVYGAEGQSITALADEVAYKLQDMTRRKELIWG